MLATYNTDLLTGAMFPDSDSAVRTRARCLSAQSIATGWEKVNAKDLQGAGDCVNAALQHDHENEKAWLLAAHLLFTAAKSEEALRATRRALELDPDSVEGQMLLALCIWVLESPAAGIRKLRFLSLTTKPPELVSVYECLAGRLFWNPAADDFDFAEAQAYCLALDGAALQRTRFARGWNRLARGCYNQAAWSDFEERFATLYSGEKIIDSREHWDGSLLNGKTLLVDMEGALGDCIQFLRFLPVVKAAGGRIIVMLERSTRSIRLLPLLERCRLINEIVLVDKRKPGMQMPRHDFALSLLSFPKALRTTLDTIPDGHWLPDLPREKMDRAKARIGDGPGFRIGLSWASSGGARDIPLSNFAELAEVPGVRLYGLQRGPAAKELESVSFPVTNLEDDESMDILDTAAFIPVSMR